MQHREIYKKYKLNGLLDSKDLYQKKHNDYDKRSTIVKDFKSRFKILDGEFECIVGEYADIPSIKKKFINSRKEGFNNDPVIFYDWFKEQNDKCGYCGIAQEDLYKIFSKKLLPLNDKLKRSSGTLEIERLDSSDSYEKTNMILACPLCNNAKSNLIDEVSWREYFVAPMQKYYQKLLREN